MSRMYRTNRDPMYKVGEIIRYEYGPSALMQIETVVMYGEEPRYYGLQCCGGGVGAYHRACERATDEDYRVWVECEKWRKL